MWTARIEGLKTLLTAAIGAKRRASGCDAARVVAYAQERLQNNFLLADTADGMPRPFADHDSFQVRSQGTARCSCGAH